MILPVLKICGNIPASVQLLYNLARSGEISLADFLRARLITLHSNFEIFLKGHPAVKFMLDRRIFER